MSVPFAFDVETAERILKTLSFRAFTRADHYAYSGCESRCPLIANFELNCWHGDVIKDAGEFEFHFFNPSDVMDCKTFVFSDGCLLEI